MKVVVRKNFLGVVAEKRWQAMQAAGRLKVNWSEGTGLPPQREFYARLRTQPSRDAFVVNSKDVDETLARAAAIVTATYRHPYQMHGSIGTSCAVADVQGDRATVWSATQSAYPTRSGVAMLLGVPPDNVRVIFTGGSGCYGINGADTVSYDAALLSQAVAQPVRVQLSRKDEMAWENYGLPYVIDQRAGVGATGRSSRGTTRRGSRRAGGRPGYQTPGNVVTGMLAGFAPEPFQPQPAPEPAGGSTTAATPHRPTLPAASAGRAGGAGTIASERVLTHTVRRHSSPGRSGRRLACRTPSRTNASSTKWRRSEGRSGRVSAAPPSRSSTVRRRGGRGQARELGARGLRPAPDRRRTGVAAGRGMACVVYEGNNGYVAMVAEVEVDQGTGRIAARRLVVAQDCGPDLESRRHAQSDRRRRAPGPQSCAWRRSHVGRSQRSRRSTGGRITV